MRWLRKIRYWRQYKSLKAYIESFGCAVEPEPDWDGISANLDRWRWLEWKSAVASFHEWISSMVPDGCLEFCLYNPSTLHRFMEWPSGAVPRKLYGDQFIEFMYCGIEKMISPSDDWKSYFDGCEIECQERIDSIRAEIGGSIHIVGKSQCGGCMIRVYDHENASSHFYSCVVDEWNLATLSCTTVRIKGAIEKRKKECIVHHASDNTTSIGRYVSPQQSNNALRHIMESALIKSYSIEESSDTTPVITFSGLFDLKYSDFLDDAFDNSEATRLNVEKAFSLARHMSNKLISRLVYRLSGIGRSLETAGIKRDAIVNAATPREKAIILASLTSQEIVRWDGKTMMSILRSIPEDIQAEFGLLTGMPGVSAEEAMNTVLAYDGKKVKKLKLNNGSSIAWKPTGNDGAGSEFSGLTTDLVMMYGEDSHFDLPALRPKSEWETNNGYRSPKVTAYVLDESYAPDAIGCMAMARMAAKDPIKTSEGMMALPRTQSVPNLFNDLYAQLKHVDLRKKYASIYEYYSDKRLARWLSILGESLVGHSFSTYPSGDRVIIESGYCGVIRHGFYETNNDWSLDLLKSAFCNLWIDPTQCDPAKDHLDEVEELWNSIDENGCSKRGCDWAADEKFTISLDPKHTIKSKVKLGSLQTPRSMEDFYTPLRYGYVEREYSSRVSRELAEKSNKAFFDSIMGVRSPSAEEVKRAIADIKACYRRPTPVLHMKPAQWMDIALSLVKDQNDCSNWSASKVREITEKFEPAPRKKDSYV